MVDRPALLCGGGAVVALEGVVALVAFGVAVRSGIWTGVLAAVAGLVAVDVFVVPAVLPGVVAGARWGATDVPWNAASQRTTGRLLPVTLAAVAVTLLGGLLAALALAGVTLVGLTAVEFGANTVTEWSIGVRPTVGLLGLVAVVSVLLVRVAVGFAGHLVVDRRVAALRAPRVSVHLVRHHPRTIAQLAAGRGVLFALPWLAAAGVSATFTPGAVRIPEAVVYLAVGTVTRTLSLTGSAATYEARLAASASQVTVPRGLPRPGRGPALALVVLVGAVTGAGAVRIADVDPGARGPSAVDAETPPTVAVERAFDRLETASYQRTDLYYSGALGMNDSDPDRLGTTRVDSDRTRSTVSVASNGSLSSATRYTSETTIAYNVTTLGDPNLNGTVWDHGVADVSRTGGWLVLVRVPLGTGIDEYDADAAQWHVHERSDGTITYGVDDPAAVATVVWELPPASRVDYRNETLIRATVDRETGYLERVYVYRSFDLDEPVTIQANRGTLEIRSGQNSAVERRYTDYGGTDLKRPDGLGPRRPLELLVDALAY